MKTWNTALIALAFAFAGLASADSAGYTSRPRAESGWTAVTPTPTPTPDKRPRVAPSQTPTVSPTPPAATPTPRPQTFEELQAKIRNRVFSPEVKRGRVGVKIVSLASGKVVFENDADKYFMPASNMKNFTVAAAFERLGPEFKFVTSVFAAAPPDSTGTIRGDLRVYGRGDVSISTAFFGTSADDPETYYKGIDRLVDKIAAAGIKRVEGSIVGDESYFRGFPIPTTWEWDDLQWYYGAEISALPINDNAVDLSVAPASVGTPCIVKISPPNTLYQVINTCSTSSATAKRALVVNKRIDRNILEVSGSVPVGEKGYNSPVSITRPAELFVAILKQRLEKRGITVAGPSRLLSPGASGGASDIEVSRLESVPFREIAAKTLKPSQNMFTETILWTLGEQIGRAAAGVTTTPAESSQLGISVVKSFLTSIGIPADAVVQYDGCGMSRHDQVTPDSVAALYTYMAKRSANAQAWRDSLTIGGVDGTLTNRFKGTAAAGNIRGKTGTIDQVSALSGYLKTAAGEELVISLLVNGVPEGRQRVSLIDDVVVALANYDGRID